MKIRYTLFIWTLLSLPSRAQERTVSPAYHSLTLTNGKSLAEATILIGRQFLGQPYVSHTLDGSSTEQLIVNMTEFDCTTYVETVAALALTSQELANRSEPALFDQTFRRYLTKLRYRDGHINGYASRLHYFSEWLLDNERKGLVADVSSQLPGVVVVAKPVSHMTTSTDKYPQLNDPVIFKQIAQTEAMLSGQTFSFIPTKNVGLAETQLRDGDIIMLMAARPGLDMKHVGLVVRQADGRVHLLHASSDRAAVVTTAGSLHDYLQSHKHLSGIRVARLRMPVPALAAAADGN